jgi:3-methylcrotonyl-CoA carboxylase alpha subunit
LAELSGIMASEVHFRGRTVAFDISSRRPTLRLRIGDAEHAVHETAGADGAIEIEIDGERFRGWRWVAGNEVYVRLGGHTFRATLIDLRSGDGGDGKSGNALYAEMPGTVIDVRVQAGDAVVTGQVLMTIESMKLQMTIVAPFDGTIETVHVAPQASFERDTLLVSLRHAADAADQGR